MRTACAQVPEDASSAEALASVAKPLRYGSDALLCAISGYPGSGCGEQVAQDSGGGRTATADASAPTSAGVATGGDGADGGGPSAGVLAGVGAVLLLGIAAVAQARRRRG